MVDTTHLEKMLARDLEALRGDLKSMADLVFRQLEDSMTAFAEANRKLAYTVVLRDRRIDMLEQHIDRMSQEFLVRHMPVAKQLRFVVAAVKANSELERIGDYAEAIARRAVTISESEKIPQRDQIVEMSRHATEMLRNAMAAFLDDDPDLAVRTLDADNRVDEMHSAIFTELARAPVQRDDLTVRFALLGVVSRIERVADRACNIAEDAVYVSSGEVMRHLSRDDNRVLFLCDHNSCRSQMAEGIARAIAPANFIFASAGTEPAQSIDRHAVEFLSKEGIDISRQRPKPVSDVGPIEDFHVVVTLTRAAEDACPPVPYHAVALNWRLTDPSRATGSEEEIEAVYSEIYATLRAKIAEMIEAFEQGLEK